MAYKMSDAEVWLEFAEHMRRGGVLPDYCASGLCDLLYGACDENIIDFKQLSRMKTQLRRNFAHLQREDFYFWRPGAIAPRIRACEALAKECMRNG